MARQVATKYSRDSFLRLASEEFDEVTETWIPVEQVEQRRNLMKAQRPVDPPPPTKEQKIHLRQDNCDCSCCAWAVSYTGRDMRFLFGYL
jgi:hypothetical protein